MPASVNFGLMGWFVGYLYLGIRSWKKYVGEDGVDMGFNFIGAYNNSSRSRSIGGYPSHGSVINLHELDKSA